MKRIYTLTLKVEGPDDTDLNLLDRTLERVVEWSTAREVIETSLFGSCDHLNVNVTSLRMDRKEA